MHHKDYTTFKENYDMNKFLTLLVVGFITVAMSLSWTDSSYAKCGDSPDCGKKKMACFEAPGGPIDLTEAQFAEVSQLRQAEQEKLGPIHKELKSLHEKMRSAMENEPVNEGLIRQLAQQKADRKVDLKLAQREFRMKVEALLTPEQVVKMKEHRESNREEHGKRDGHGQQHGKPGCGNCMGSHK